MPSDKLAFTTSSFTNDWLAFNLGKKVVSQDKKDSGKKRDRISYPLTDVNMNE